MARRDPASSGSADGECVRQHDAERGRAATAVDEVSLLIVDPDDTTRFIRSGRCRALESNSGSTTRAIVASRRRITLDAIHP
jgi:hypothetical protein